MQLSGFSLGDELGFGESLSNTDSNRRRSLNVKTGTNGVYPGEQKIMVRLVIKYEIWKSFTRIIL